MLVKYDSIDEFREDFRTNPQKLDGKVVTFKDDINLAFVVGKHEYEELDIRKYNGFLGNLMRHINDNTDFMDQVPKLITERRDLEEKNKSLLHRLENRKQISDKELKTSAVFSTTRFAAIIQACNGKDEMLKSIDTASNDIVDLVYSFKDNKFSPKKFIIKEDL
ncbi:MAG: hypothetical protein ABUK08_00135 [Candidatus Humimicrobiaceae bacterium]